MSEGDLMVNFAAIRARGSMIATISFDAVLLHLGRWLDWRSRMSSCGYFHDGRQWCGFRCHDERTYRELEPLIGTSVRVIDARAVYDNIRDKFVIHLDDTRIVASNMPTFQTRPIPSFTPRYLKENLESVFSTIRSTLDWIAVEKVVTIENVRCTKIEYKTDGYHYSLRTDDDDTLIDLCSGEENLWRQLNNARRRLLYTKGTHFDVIGCQPYNRLDGVVQLDVVGVTRFHKRGEPLADLTNKLQAIDFHRGRRRYNPIPRHALGQA